MLIKRNVYFSAVDEETGEERLFSVNGIMTEEEYLESTYKSYILNEYYDWVCGHDHEFIAERVGLDIDACRDDEIDYTIHL